MGEETKKTGSDLTGGTQTSKQTADLEEKKRQAMLAMEGEEGKLRRENLERKKQEEELKKNLQVEKISLKKQIETLEAEKEKMELKWISLNETKAPLEKALEPVVSTETKIEQEEDEVEKKEHSSSDPKERQAAERQRWDLEDRRRATEKERWRLEDEIGKINAIIEANSAKYRDLLAEEEKAEERLLEIDKNLSVYGE